MVVTKGKKKAIPDDLMSSLKVTESVLQQSPLLSRTYTECMYRTAEEFQKSIKASVPDSAAVLKSGQVLADVLGPAMKAVTASIDVDALTDSLRSVSSLIDNVLPQNIDETTHAMADSIRVLAYATASVKTPEIEALSEAYQHQYLTDGMQTFFDTIASSKTTQVANIALVRNILSFSELGDKQLPYGWKTTIRKMHKTTAEKLAQSTDISVDIEKRCFIVDDAPNLSATIDTINVIASSTDLFAGIKESELIELTNKLEWGQQYAFECSAARTIDSIIRDWNAFIDFDKEFYYHSRRYKDGAPFYTDDEMRKAPREYVGNGRYNYSGNSHYYFADTEDGAKQEVKKHCRDAKLQVAKLRPIKPIRMIDLSEKNKKKIAFLDYIRFDAEPGAVMPQQYYIPQFVCGCCRHANIEGIKYYGSQKYNNYVSWKDDYFDVVDSWR